MRAFSFCVIAFLLVAGLGCSSIGTPPRSDRQAANKPAVGDPIRVGLLVSHFTVTGPTWTGERYTHWITSMTLEDLHREDLQLVAVHEPGGADAPENAEVLAHPAFAGRTLSAADPAALGKLDVLVIPRVPNATSEVTAAILNAQRAGLDVVNTSSYGTVTPTYADPSLFELHGIEAGAYFWKFGTKAVVVEEHPLLGNLKVGDTLTVGANGIGGRLGDAQVLLDVTPDFEKPFGPGPTLSDPENDQNLRQPILYLSQVGDGRILQCNWLGKLPPQLTEEFLANAVRWMSDRPLQSLDPETETLANSK